jgi:hypothetical protein
MSKNWLTMITAMALLAGIAACDQQQGEQSGEAVAPTQQQQSVVPDDSSGGNQGSVPQGTD